MSKDKKETKAPTAVMKEIEQLIGENNLEVVYRLDFPIYKVLPDEVQFALRMLDKHGMQMSFDLREKK